MAAQVFRHRILVAELDSLAVASRYAAASNPLEAEEQLVGVLRAAHLIGQEIVLTDSMLFDSRFFASVTPAELGSYLGWPPKRLPLTVVHQGPDLRTALDLKLAKGDAFHWQLPRAVDGSWPQHVRESWDAWICAAERGHLTLEGLLERDGIPKPAFALDVDLAEVAGIAASDPFVGGIVAAAASTPDRSAVWQAVEAGRAAHPTGARRDDVERLWAVWNAAYFDAMAGQHGADWVRFTPADRGASPASGRGRLHLSGALLELATAVPPAVYAHLLFAARPEREAFFEHRTEKRLFALAYRAQTAADQGPGLREVRRRALTSLVVTVAALLLTAPVFDDPSFRAISPWVLFAAVGFLTFPLADVAPLWRLRRGRLSAVLSLEAP